MKIALFLLALAIPACQLPLAWDDVPTATVTPVLDDSAMNYTGWSEEVAAAIETWNAPLRARGCAAPFVLGESGHTITLIAGDAWVHGDDVGITFSDGLINSGSVEIQQRVRAPLIHHRMSLIHELGHALGLGHSDHAYGPSLMNHQLGDISDVPYPRDLDAAACVLGCGSCDLEDRFDLN